MRLRHFSCPYHGQSFLCVKKWFEVQISGILPDVLSFISHFVCLYNFDYTGRNIIQRYTGLQLISLNESKTEKTHAYTRR